VTGAKGPIYHLREEVNELIRACETNAAIDVEVADCMILLFVIAHLSRFSAGDAVLAKHTQNVQRTWGEPDEDGVSHHQEEEGDV
jgi:NTP pyrophosphatase (non-canonical NTP hydrolase)